MPGHVVGLVSACSGVVPEVLTRGEGHGSETEKNSTSQKNPLHTSRVS